MNRLALAGISCLVVLGSGSRLMAQSIDFGTAPQLKFPGQAEDGKIYFYGQATFATGSTPSITLNICPEDGGRTLINTVGYVPIKGLPVGQSGVTFGTKTVPFSIPQTLAPNKSYLVWLVMQLSQGGSTSFVYSTWYRMTIVAGNGTDPGVAAASVTLTPNPNNGAGRVVADATVTLQNGWINNTAPGLSAIPTSVATTGPGQGPPSQVAIPVGVPGNPNGWTANFNYGGVTAGVYKLICFHPIKDNVTGSTQLVASVLSAPYTVQ